MSKPLSACPFTQRCLGGGNAENLKSALEEIEEWVNGTGTLAHTMEVVVAVRKIVRTALETKP